MAQDIPESKPVVQLPVATHSSIYSHNLTKKDYWINCQAGGLGFYTLLGRNPITLISVGSTSQKIMPAFQIDIGHDYECWLNMLLSMCWDSKFHGFRYYLTICPLSVEITFCIILYFIVSLGHIVDSALLLYLKYNLSYPALGIS